MLGWFRKKPPAPAGRLPEQPDTIRVEERLRRGRAFRDSGKLREAESELRAALTELPEATGHFELGNLLQMQNRLMAAETSYRIAISADPSHADAHNCLGVVLHRLSRNEESLAAHQRA